VTLLIHRRVFSDWSSLWAMMAGQPPNIDEISRRIFVQERKSDHRRPDHFYKGYLDDRIGKAGTFRDLVGGTLGAVGDHHLEWSRGRTAVKPAEFEHWQHGLPFLSPLAIAVHWMRRNLPGGAPQGVENRLHEVTTSLRHTALLSPTLPELEDLIQRDGLNEMHLHLNGSTELDILWVQAVGNPRPYLRELKLAQRDRKTARVRELYDQIEVGLTAERVFRALQAAQRVRWAVTQQIARTGDRPAGWPCSIVDATRDRPGRRTLPGAGGKMQMHRHPVEALYPRLDFSTVPLLHREALWLWRCFDAMESAPDGDPNPEEIALGLFFNLTVLTLVSRLAIQQVDEFGFDQFQKYTLAGTREPVEKTYRARFDQMGVSVDGDHDHLEGRFAPKPSVEKNARLLEAIAKGYLRHIGCKKARGLRTVGGKLPPCLDGRPCPSGQPRKRTRLNLVAHFIKQPDRAPSAERLPGDRCRHRKLRRTLDQSGMALLSLLRSSALARRLITGIDAAANELEAPPAVFAPLYRRMRRARMPHATYHVGEDFVHLVSGIRAVVEAVEYLDLRNGDRVGHATALGIDPLLWRERIGPRLMMRVEDALDDAVFAFDALSQKGEAPEATARLRRRIEEWQLHIHGRHVPIETLIAAWRLRRLDALIATDVGVRSAIAPLLDREDAAREGDGQSAFDALRAATQNRHRRSELDLIEEAVGRNPQAFKLFLDHHDPDIRRRGREMVEVTIDDAPETMRSLQAVAVENLRKRNVVIETLPTSNLRISYYDTYRQHHLFRWLGVDGGGDEPRPNVCVGSDDTGIFSTNLRNEYAHLYLTLTEQMKLSGEAARDQVRRLNDCGRVYRFDRQMPRGTGAGRHHG
jgi:adenosine deaminase